MSESMIDAPADRSVAVEPDPGKGPPLMVVYPRKLKPEAIANLRRAMESTFKGPGPLPPAIVFEDGAKVYQLVDDRWQPVTL